MVLWTVVLLASFATAVSLNIANNHIGTALRRVAIPAELWLVLGISTTSLVASPLILRRKRKVNLNVEDAKRTLARMDMRLVDESVSVKKVEERFDGQVERNASPKDASFADLFRGEQDRAMPMSWT